MGSPVFAQAPAQLTNAGPVQPWGLPPLPQGIGPVEKFADVGRQPYDGLVTPDGRWYIAGLFGEDGLALLDLWHPERGVRRILDKYGNGEQKLPSPKAPSFIAVNKKTGKPVPDAVIFATRLDMGPEGMPEMATAAAGNGKAPSVGLPNVGESDYVGVPTDRRR